MKRIGFFDYRLDNFHAEVYLTALRGPLSRRGYVASACTALEEAPSREWAKQRSLPYCATLDEFAEQVDFVMVLAPSNPELHLAMCRAAFALGKPTFVDKTFATNEAEARAIFAMADERDVPLQSTSALRSTAVQQCVADLAGTLQSLVVYASGSSLAEYAIHPVELAVSCLGPDVQRVMRLGPDAHPQFILEFSDRRTALIDLNLGSDVPFAATVSAPYGHEHVPIDSARLFVDAMASILDFFDAGRPLIDRRETLAVRRVLDVIEGTSLGEFASCGEAIALAPPF
ncbi:MAG: hypothetical protein CMJ58_12960 [Planctomycetaceae bacterium]|nr:hypothetical protein [Planctomycetaceae bacterium]